MNGKYLYRARLVYNKIVNNYYSDNEYHFQKGELLKVETKHGLDLALYLGVTKLISSDEFHQLMTNQQSAGGDSSDLIELEEEVGEHEIEALSDLPGNRRQESGGNHRSKKQVKIEGALVDKAREEDLNHFNENRRKEAEALAIFTDKIKEHKLPMKPVGTHYFLDDRKILFDFVADRRIDFRELVRSLATIFKRRIELHQIGVRDEARMIDGIFSCGQQLCCRRFLHSLNPISIKMAKNQNAPLNTMKISGYCGRLLCCLQYENEFYEQGKSRYPDEGTEILVAGKSYILYEVNLLTQVIKMKEMRGSVFLHLKLEPFEYTFRDGRTHLTKWEQLTVAQP